MGGIRDRLHSPSGVPRQFEDALTDVQRRYPPLRNLNAVLTPVETEGGAIEYFSPQEGRNPYPGRITLGIRGDAGQVASPHNLIAGDLLHYLGETDEQGTPRNADFHHLKKEFERTLTDDQHMINRFQYRRNLHDNRIHPDLTYQDFLDMSGTDQYIRGAIFPDYRNEWNQPGRGEFTPEQRGILGRIKQFLHTNQRTPE